jgi:probable rRNA maturation factor
VRKQAKQSKKEEGAVLRDVLKDHVLGKKYELSFAFLGPKKMTEVTWQTKKKRKASNVLSFPLSDTSGEILICKSTASKEAKLYGMNKETFIVYLFIHGLLHLKGLQHGATMDSEERRVMRRFGLRTNEQSSNRN